MPDEPTEPDLLTGGEAAEILLVSTERVRQLANAGRIPDVIMSPSGDRLYKRSVIETLAAQGITQATRKRALAARAVPATEGIVIPAYGDLWMRHQLAVSVLSQRGPTAESAALVARILDGDTVELLAREVS